MHSLGSHLLPLGVIAEGIDHPRRHVVDGDEGRHRRAALRQRLEDQRRVEPGQRRAADVVADVDAADAERGRLAHHVDRKMLLLVPADRMRRDLFRGEGPRHLANRYLVLVESEMHLPPAPTLFLRMIHSGKPVSTFPNDARQFIVGMENSAPSLTPDGQREVIVLVLV